VLNSERQRGKSLANAAAKDGWIIAQPPCDHAPAQHSGCAIPRSLFMISLAFLPEITVFTGSGRLF
jgi:hypothetical protein